MVQLINFGQVTTQNGKTFLSGIGSGMDSAALIAGMVKIKQAPVNTLNDNITANNNKISSYQQLQSLLTAFQTAINGLRNPPTFQQINTADVFQGRTVSLSSNNASVTAGSVMNVTATGVTPGSYVFQNISLATAQNQQTNQKFSSATTPIVSATPSAGQFGAGTFTINNTVNGQAISQQITLTAGMALNDIANAINSVTNVTNVSATVIQTSGAPTYELIMQSTLTGVANAYSISDPNNIFNNASKITWNAANNAQDASFQFNGTNIDSPSNTITNLIPGMTISLLSAPNPSTTQITAQVNYDTSSVDTAMNNLVTAYNNLVTFNAQMNQRTLDAKNQYSQYASTAYLGGDQTLNTIMQKVISDMNAIVGGLPSGDNFNSLAAVGFSWQKSQMVPAIPVLGTNSSSTTFNVTVPNYLVFNQATFDQAQSTNFQYIRQLFSIAFSTTGPISLGFDRSNKIANPAIGSFSVNPNQLSSLSTQPFGNSTTESVVAATSTNNMFTAGTFQINGTNVTLTAGQTLTQVADAINAVSATTNVTAAIAAVNTGYQLSLTPTGSSTEFTITDASNIFIYNQNVASTKTLAPDAATMTYTNAAGGTNTINLPFSLTYSDAASKILVGGTILGPAGSIIDGLSFFYTGGANAVSGASFTLTQGIGDLLYNDVSNFMGQSTSNQYPKISSVITAAINGLQSQNTQYQKEITSLNDNIAAYQQQLMQQFASLNKATANSNKILQTLSANDAFYQAATNTP